MSCKNRQMKLCLSKMGIKIDKPNPDKPYNSLPLLPPKDFVETASLLKKVVEAHEVRQALERISDQLPNKEVLLNTLPILEAKDSSGIEGVITTADELFQLDMHRPNEYEQGAKEAYRYCMALKRGLSLLEARHPFNFNLAVEIASMLLGTTVSLRRHTVVLKNPITGRCYYTPPNTEAVLLKALKNWEIFLNEDKSNFDPLTRWAIAHYQFEAIHPFSDGNGRTGRILNLLFLVKLGLLTSPIVYLSSYLLLHRQSYYQCLHSVTFESAWEPMILFMVEAFISTTQETQRKILKLQTLIQNTQGHLSEHWKSTVVEKLLKVLFTQPYCRTKDFVAAGVAKRQTVAMYIERLIQLQILQDSGLRGATGKLYVHGAFLELLKQPM